MKYIASWSGGKDSTASIILAHEHNEPLDLIIFSEVMFDENISGELPEHIEFIHRCIPIFESWGYEVKILHAKDTYMSRFERETVRGKRAGSGLKVGFPISLKCDINKSVKIKAIKNFQKSINEDFVQYVGIATDEPLRLDRVAKTDNQISLLKKYGYTENMAFELCMKYDMLSPIYAFTPRGGCWFCPNCGKSELRHLYDFHRELFDKLVELEQRQDLIGDIWGRLQGKKIADIAETFKWEDCQMTIFDYLKSKEKT